MSSSAVPIAVRLLVALGSLALFVTALVGFSARNVARREVERGFAERIDAGTSRARDELAREAGHLGRLMGSLCAPDGRIDAALGDLERVGGDVERLGQPRRDAMQAVVAEQRRALGFDELLLVAPDGFVLAAAQARIVGRRRPELSELVRAAGGSVRVSDWSGRPALEVHCARAGRGAGWGLVGYRELAPLLGRVGAGYGVTLSLRSERRSADEGADVLRRELTIPEIPGLDVVATGSRAPLTEALGKIDRSIALAGGIAVLLAIALAVLLAGSLSRPLVELARETRAVVRGKPRPVRVRGGRELRELARAFNRTIDELAAMRRRLAVSERIAARREIARQIAHEIKNPLAPIRAAVETLRRLRERGSPEFDGYFEEATATVLEEVHRIAAIVSEFTKFARLPAPKPARIDVGAVARSVVGLHDGKGITGAPRVVLEIEPVPEVLADRDQLVQVLENLVQNGIEAARSITDPPIMPRVVVRVRCDSEHTVLVSVKDNGPGIDPAIRERLFEPYASTKPGGTGLGLAIAQRIVFEHGGEIRCAADDGDGALFEVVLPIDGPPLTQPAPTPAGQPRG